MNYTITADGGGGEAVEAGCYGSICIEPGHKMTTFDFPNLRTSNEAEYAAVIAGLDELSKMLGSQAKEISVLIQSDSMLVIKQCQRKWKIKARHLVKFRDHVLKLACRFQKVYFRWIPGEEVKAILGH